MKKKVIIHSNYCKNNTGFAKAKRNILLYLYKTGKYEIIELANGFQKGDDSFSSTPWKCIGTIPSNPAEVQQIQQNPALNGPAGYGHMTIDQIIQEEKPDVYLGIEDVWAFKLFELKSWWNKLTPIIWTTLDSLPLLPETYDLAKVTKNFFVWADFATKEMKRLGYNNVETLHGPIDLENFKPLPPKRKDELRRKFGLHDSFVVGFVFRNQLRKSVPNLMKGFSKFKKNNPKSNGKLLLHTYWQEGWDIRKLALENEIDLKDIFTTYFCNQCSEYFVANYQGEACMCSHCHSPTLNTTNIVKGVSEEQLNEIYNLMDVYCHPFTSGGQEIPIQEAKLAGLITLVTNYSCGEEYCTDENAGVSLSWDEYREPGSQFIKASTKPESISYNLDKVYKMSPVKREALGAKARDWVLKNFSIEAVCKRFEAIIDAAPFVDADLKEIEEIRDINYTPPEGLSNEQWVDDVLKNMLKRPFDHKHREAEKILEALNQGRDKKAILDLLRQNGEKENQNLAPKVTFESLIDENINGRVAVVLPQSAVDVFLSTSLLKSIKDRYPNKDLYYITNPQNFEILMGNPHIYKLIPYHPSVDSAAFLEGVGSHKGFFDIAYRLHTVTQNDNLYSHNGLDTIDFNLNEKN